MPWFWETAKTADDYREMKLKEFFSEGVNEPDFYALPLDTRREIIARKFNLSYAEYSAIPATIRVHMWMTASGKTYHSGVVEGIDAAEEDARGNSIRAYFKGMAGGSGALLIGGAVVALLVFQQPIAKALKVQR